MAIKEWTFGLTSGGYLPYRTYIWAGARGVDLNGDGDTIDIIPADTTVTPAKPEQNEATMPSWCFTFGEEDWRSGDVFSTTRDAAIGDADTDPIGRINCTTGAAI